MGNADWLRGRGWQVPTPGDLSRAWAPDLRRLGVLAAAFIFRSALVYPLLGDAVSGRQGDSGVVVDAPQVRQNLEAVQVPVPGKQGRGC